MGFDRVSRNWTVQKGDTLWGIASQVYQDGAKYPKIRDANSIVYDEDLIFPGWVLYCPPENDTNENTNIADIDDGSKYKITIDGNVLKYVDGMSIELGLNQAVRTFGFSIPFDPDKHKDIVKPFKKVEFKIDNIKVFEGITLTPKSSVSKSSGRVITMQCASKSHSLTVSHYEITKNKIGSWEYVTLKTIINDVLNGSEIKAMFDEEDPIISTALKTRIEKIGIGNTETKLNFLSKLANDNGMVISGTAAGDLFFTRAKTDKKAIKSFIESDNGVEISVDCNYDELAQKIRVTTEKGDNGSGAYKDITNDYIDRKIFKNIEKPDNLSSNLETAGKWLMGRELAESVKCTVTTPGFTDDNDSLYADNNIINVRSESNGIYEDMKFLIESVRMDLTRSGKITTINCVLPESYSGKSPDKLPFM